MFFESLTSASSGRNENAALLFLLLFLRSSPRQLVPLSSPPPSFFPSPLPALLESSSRSSGLYHRSLRDIPRCHNGMFAPREG